MKKVASHKWCVFRLDNKNFLGIEKEMRSKGYLEAKVFIPTLSILKKRSKGKDIYEQVPLLFNYGFMRLPREKAYSRPFIKKLQKDILGIVCFLNSLEGLHTKKKRKRVDGEEFDDFSVVAMVTPKQVREFKKLSKQNQIYTFEDISSVSEGDYITLRGYPFNGVEATVKEINLKNQLVKVCLYPNNGNMEVYIPFDNLIYSIYHNFDDNKLLCNSYELDTNLQLIPDESDESN